MMTNCSVRIGQNYLQHSKQWEAYKNAEREERNGGMKK
jgi:hypothetical protein